MSPIKFNAPWHPLRHAWVGSSYSPEFYEPIRNHQIRDGLQRIAAETEQDYKNLIAVLESFGIQVDRPRIDPDLTIMDHVNQQGQVTYDNSKSFTLIPRPPMQPRDSMLIVGETMIQTNSELDWFRDAIVGFDLGENQYHPLRSNNFDAPLITVIGKHLVVDCRDHPRLADYIQQLCPDRTVIPVMIGGHNDAVFCPVRPGLIVSTHHHTNYADTFPGWHVKHIENQSWNAIPEWRTCKHANVDKWWIPDEYNNAEFGKFVDTWLGHWLGHVAETVFDVNMLQINESTILVNNFNKEMFDFFALHGIDPIITPFRHRFFWDGGIHCVTNDIYREGECDVYIAH